MLNHIGIIAAAAFFTVTTPGAVGATSALLGDWVQNNGDNTVRISLCANGDGMCATVVAEKRVAGEASRLNSIAVRNIVPSHQGEWKGVFQDGQDAMSATVRADGANRISLKICARPMLCDTLRYTRLAPRAR